MSTAISQCATLTAARGRCAKGIDAWLKAWRGPTFSMLSMQDNGDEIIVEDTRAIAVEREHRVRGLEREILLAADEGSP
ncbi:hypothetical protein [Bradyrhizobium sp. CCBAU 53380]|uniref:hypothetical protein n=1 Tax=Bradyrhizobium sp. CCBAU 53380 TaxID=1325117 RepID=UPI002304D0B2|nr:hypothetical protein [Bradyrhizobium sp. CCBAU 53380]